MRAGLIRRCWAFFHGEPGVPGGRQGFLHKLWGDGEDPGQGVRPSRAGNTTGGVVLEWRPPPPAPWRPQPNCSCRWWRIPSAREICSAPPAWPLRPASLPQPPRAPAAPWRQISAQAPCRMRRPCRPMPPPAPASAPNPPARRQCSWRRGSRRQRRRGSRRGSWPRTTATPPRPIRICPAGTTTAWWIRPP